MKNRLLELNTEQWRKYRSILLYEIWKPVYSSTRLDKCEILGFIFISSSKSHQRSKRASSAAVILSVWSAFIITSFLISIALNALDVRLNHFESNAMYQKSKRCNFWSTNLYIFFTVCIIISIPISSIPCPFIIWGEHKTSVSTLCDGGGIITHCWLVSTSQHLSYLFPHKTKITFLTLVLLHAK